MKPLPLAWIKTVDPERREEFEKLLRNNSQLFQKLHEIIKDMEHAVLAEERSKDYSGSWSHLQAHRNGNLEAYKKLQDLISFSIKGTS